MAYNIEEAGFVIRDIIAWLYGSGFPKSHDIGKGIDKKMGAEREEAKPFIAGDDIGYDQRDSTERERRDIPVSDQAKQYEGWGTALKPAMEMFTLVRKPLINTVADNVLKYGTGGINIDECRVGDEERTQFSGKGSNGDVYHDYPQRHAHMETVKGRFPANIIHDGSDEVVNLFPNIGEESPARFFYTPKASQSERNEGLYEFDKKYTASAEFRPNHMEKATEGQSGNPYGRWQPKKNIHPTVKPIELMRYLVRLITPKGGLCLDPYVGSGTTAIACKQEKKEYIGIEIDEEYHSIAEARIKAAVVEYNMFDYL
jgi:site-specific DNA-methyltransferase (adenine-specific)